MKGLEATVTSCSKKTPSLNIKIIHISGTTLELVHKECVKPPFVEIFNTGLETCKGPFQPNLVCALERQNHRTIELF